jgi:hypothetical protein
MHICVIGKYFANAKHGAEQGIVDALRELNDDLEDLTSVDIFEPPQIFMGGVHGWDDIEYDWESCAELLGNTHYDLVLVVGPGLPKKALECREFCREIVNHRTVCWNSEPIRLPNYRSRVEQQGDLIDEWATFDEGEIPIYEELGAKAFFLPQAFNPKWYYPRGDIDPDGYVCFVGSAGGKWENRITMVRRVKALFGTDFSVSQVFDAVQVNKIYNAHAIVLNLGLYHKDLGSPQHLASYAFQQRIFEAIGAGAIPCTNRPADLDSTTRQKEMFECGMDIIYYENDTLEAILKHYAKNPEQLAAIHKRVLQIRDQHTYKARLKELFDRYGQDTNHNSQRPMSSEST